MRKFAVCIEWNYRGTPEQQFEHCIVAPATPEDEEHDGDNCVGGRGADGFEFSVHNSLAEAILNTGYNPFKMTFEDLTEEETKEKDELLSKCTWTPESGIQIARTTKPKVITLCGSTKFKTEFEQKNKELTLAGNIVISVGLFGHSGDVITAYQKLMLDDLHKRKIDMADAIYVINKGGYIGSSTLGEIQYAKQAGKEILFMEVPNQDGQQTPF